MAQSVVRTTLYAPQLPVSTWLLQDTNSQGLNRETKTFPNPSTLHIPAGNPSAAARYLQQPPLLPLPQLPHVPSWPLQLLPVLL